MALVGIQCATVIDQYCYYYWLPTKEQYKHLIATKEKKIQNRAEMAHL